MHDLTYLNKYSFSNVRKLLSAITNNFRHLGNNFECCSFKITSQREHTIFTSTPTPQNVLQRKKNLKSFLC